MATFEVFRLDDPAAVVWTVKTYSAGEAMWKFYFRGGYEFLHSPNSAADTLTAITTAGVFGVRQRRTGATRRPRREATAPPG